MCTSEQLKGSERRAKPDTLEIAVLGTAAILVGLLPIEPLSPLLSDFAQEAALNTARSDKRDSDPAQDLALESLLNNAL